MGMGSASFRYAATEQGRNTMQARTTSQALRRATPMSILAMMVALLAGAAVYFAISNPATAGQEIVPNPTLSSSCGVDMVIVIDRSESIDNTEFAQIKTAVNGFVDAFLPGTPTEIAVVRFDTDASVIQGFSGNAATVKGSINALPSSASTSGTQYTNWAHGLNTARDLFPNRGKPQLIVFASDGNPTARFGYDAFGPVQIDTNNEAAMLDAAIGEANAAKLAGTRIITLGIGAGSGGTQALDVPNLEAISSPDATITTNFSTLASALAELADDLCGGTITAHKIIDVDGNINTTGDQTNGAGWTMTTSVQGGTSAPPSGQTDAGGKINFDINLGGDNTATVQITETLQNGFAFISASCTGADNNGTAAANGVSGIQLSSDDIVTCKFYNRPVPVVTPSPTPPPTPSPTPPPTPSPTPPPTPSPTPTQAPTPSPTPTLAPTPTPSPEPTEPPTPTPSPEPTDEPTPEPTDAPTPTQAPTASPTAAPATQTPPPTASPAPTSLGGVQTPAVLPVSGGAPAGGNGAAVLLLLFVGMVAVFTGSGALMVARKSGR
jgi:hypothetical protein